MSLINLLTVGATFKGVKDRSGSYKLSSIAPLPKFGGAKELASAPGAPSECKELIMPAVEPSQGSLFDPASAAAPQQGNAVGLINTPEVMGTQLQAGRSPNIQRVGSEGTIDLPAKSPLRTKPSPVQSAPPEGEKPSPATPAAAKKTLPVGLQGLITRFLFGRPARPPVTATVQTELALDNVTVVRNDLSEEGCPCDSRSRKDSATTGVDTAETIGAWFNLTARFGKRASPASDQVADKLTEAPDQRLVAPM